MMDKSLLMKEDKIRMAFDHFRLSDDNCLEVAELVNVLGGETATREIMDLDSVGDRISYEQFRNMMTKSFTETEEDYFDEIKVDNMD
mmetsp:Transcript_8312/g.12263  ORF Transcript_8312/g.12263 Transcript_8312/m.12263 type:complete len:87 (+) Transcript_8312:167-427(+)